MRPMPMKNLPPLEVGQPYLAQDFEYFEYAGSALTGQKAILRLHLKNATTIDIPATDDELRHLATILCAAFGPHVIEFLRKQGWI